VVDSEGRLVFRADAEIVHGLSFESAKSVAFVDYWFSLPKQDFIPSRRDFDPCEQGPVLSSYVIHHLVSPEMIQVHLAGTAVREQYGFEATGRNYLDFVDEWRREVASRSLFLICEHPCGLLASLRSETKSGRIIKNESVGLPMRDNNGHASLIYYQSNLIDVEGYREPSEDEILKIDVMNEVYFDVGAGIPTFNQIEHLAETGLRAANSDEA
jgi:hypothetical protein